jgi:hypothetical protein
LALEIVDGAAVEADSTKAPRERDGEIARRAQVRKRYALTVVSIKALGEAATYTTPRPFRGRRHPRRRGGDAED